MLNVSDGSSSFLCDEIISPAARGSDFHRTLANALVDYDDSDEETEESDSDSPSVSSITSLFHSGTSSLAGEHGPIFSDPASGDAVQFAALLPEAAMLGEEDIQAASEPVAPLHPWHEAMQRLQSIHWPEHGLWHFGAHVDTSASDAEDMFEKTRDALNGLDLGADGPPYTVEQVARYHLVLRVLAPYNHTLLPLFESGLAHAGNSKERQMQARAKARRKRHEGPFKVWHRFKHKMFRPWHWYDLPDPTRSFARDMPLHYQRGLRAACNGLRWDHEALLTAMSRCALTSPGPAHPRIAQSVPHWLPACDATLASASVEAKDEFERFRHFVSLVPAESIDAMTRQALLRLEPRHALVGGTSIGNDSPSEAWSTWPQDAVASHNALRQHAHEVLDSFDLSDEILSLHRGWPRVDRRALSEALASCHEALCKALGASGAPMVVLKDLARKHVFQLFTSMAAGAFYEVMDTARADLDHRLITDWESTTKEGRTRFLDGLSWTSTSPHDADNPHAWRAAHCNAAIRAYKKGMRPAFDMLSSDDDETITLFAYRTFACYNPAHPMTYYQHDRFAVPQWQQELALVERRKRQMKIVEQFLAFQVMAESLCSGQTLPPTSKEEYAYAHAMKSVLKAERAAEAQARSDRRAYYSDQIRMLAWSMAPVIRALTKVVPRWRDPWSLIQHYEAKNTVSDERRQWTARRFVDSDTGRATILAMSQVAEWEPELPFSKPVEQQFAGLRVGGGCPLDEAYRQPDTYTAQRTRVFRNNVVEQTRVTPIGNFGDTASASAAPPSGAGSASQRIDPMQSFLRAGAGLPFATGAFVGNGVWASNLITSISAREAAASYQQTSASRPGAPEAIEYRK